MGRQQGPQVHAACSKGIDLGKVLIVSTSFEEQKKFEEVYAHHNTGQFSFETTASFGQDAAWWALQAPTALVLALPDDEQLLNFYFEKLSKDVPRTTKILFLASNITPGLMKVSGLFSKIRIIKTPVQPFFLYRSLVDLTTEFAEGKAQVHPRYLTDQPVEVTSDLRSKTTSGQMKNLSIGGMYFELNEVIPSFQTGDLVRVAIGLKGLRAYEFDAKVVWCKSNHTMEATGYGCTFLNREQVFDTLLTQINNR